MSVHEVQYLTNLIPVTINKSHENKVTNTDVYSLKVKNVFSFVLQYISKLNSSTDLVCLFMRFVHYVSTYKEFGDSWSTLISGTFWYFLKLHKIVNFWIFWYNLCDNFLSKGLYLNYCPGGKLRKFACGTN